MKYILTPILLVAAFFGIDLTVDVVKNDYALYKAESACVKQYNGVPRERVETGKGTCWLKEQ